MYFRNNLRLKYINIIYYILYYKMKYSKIPTNLKYNLYLYHNDIFIAKYGLDHNNINLLLKEYTQKCLETAFRNNISIDKQIKTMNKFCNNIAKMKEHCYKVKMSDLILFLNTALCLFRYNQKSWDDFILIKIKKKKKNKKTILPFKNT